MKKKLLSMILTVVMVFGMIPGLTVPAQAASSVLVYFYPDGEDLQLTKRYYKEHYFTHIWSFNSDAPLNEQTEVAAYLGENQDLAGWKIWIARNELGYTESFILERLEDYENTPNAMFSAEIDNKMKEWEAQGIVGVHLIIMPVYDNDRDMTVYTGSTHLTEKTADTTGTSVNVPLDTALNTVEDLTEIVEADSRKDTHTGWRLWRISTNNAASCIGNFSPDWSIPTSVGTTIGYKKFVLEPLYTPIIVYKGVQPLTDGCSVDTSVQRELLVDVPVLDQVSLSQDGYYINGWKLWHVKSSAQTASEPEPKECARGGSFSLEDYKSMLSYSRQVMLEPLWAPRYRICQQPDASNQYTIQSEICDETGANWKILDADEATYQWYRVDGDTVTAVPDQTAARLASAEAGVYFCKVAYPTGGIVLSSDQVDYTPAVHEHPLCGDASCADTTHAMADGWTAVITEKGLNAMESGKCYYLAGDVTPAKTIQISGSVNLCLNGFTITGDGPEVFEISSGASLTICDCSAKKTGTVEDSDEDRFSIENEGTVTLYGGKMKNRVGNDGTMSIHGGTVADTISSCGILTVTGGSISGTVTNYKGTNSTSDSARVSISGGTLTGNLAVSNNGGTVVVTGGSVQGPWRGIYNTHGSVTISGGTVSGGRENGVINYGGTLTVTGGSISGGKYGIEGIGTGDKVILSGAPVISGGTADIYLTNAGAVTIGEGGLTNSEPYTVATKTEPSGSTLVAVTSGEGTDIYAGKFTGISDEIGAVAHEGVVKLKAKPVVSFNTNGGSSIGSVSLPVEGGKVTRPANDPVRSGYTFGGWYADEELTTPFDFDKTYTTDVTLYAKWIVNIKGSVSLEGTFVLGQTVTAVYSTDVAEETFAYQWYRSSSEGYEAISGATGSTYTLTAADVGKSIKVAVSGTGSYAGTKEAAMSGTVSKIARSSAASMSGYTYGGTVSTPTVTGNTENGAVSYYYNTAKSNVNGTEWKNITATTLDAGTYYMYAVIAETENYASCTTEPVEFVVAQADRSASVCMEGYTYGGAVPTPTLSGNAGDGTAAYYYNSADSDQRSQLWSGMTGTSLDAGDWYLYAVLPETTNYKQFTTAAVKFTVSRASQSEPVTGEGYTIDYAGETITVCDGYEMNTAADGGGGAVTSGSAVTPGATIYIRKAAKDGGNICASGWVAVSIPARPAAPRPTVSEETIKNEKNGTLTGLTAEMEYKIAGGAWSAVSADQAANGIAGFSGETVSVRYRAVGGSNFASELYTHSFTPSEATITVTFDPNGGSGAMAAQYAVAGKPLTLAGNSFARSGYKFGSWNTAADGSGTSYADGAQVTLTGDLTLYARWKLAYHPGSGGAPTTVKTTGNGKYFVDVHPVDHWAEEAVDFVVERGIFSGTGATTFHPDNAMTRGMLAAVLHRLENTPGHDYTGSFADVAEDSWYADAVYWAADSGIVNGYANGLYGPDDNITREQLAVMLWRCAGCPESDHSLAHFVDADQISGYARAALAWANENGMINGKSGGILDPKGSATRAQVAQMLKNFIENIV